MSPKGYPAPLRAQTGCSSARRGHGGTSRRLQLEGDRERAPGGRRVDVLCLVGGPNVEAVAADGERGRGGVAGARPRAGGERLGVEATGEGRAGLAGREREGGRPVRG